MSRDEIDRYDEWLQGLVDSKRPFQVSDRDCFHAGFARAIKEVRAFCPSRQIDDDVGRIWNAYHAALSERLDRMEQR